MRSATLKRQLKYPSDTFREQLPMAVDMMKDAKG